MAGNANSGRREKPFLDALRMTLKEKGNAKKLRLIAQQLIDRAAAGDLGFVKELADRMDGKVPQQINHANDEGTGPLTVTWLPPEQS